MGSATKTKPQTRLQVWESTEDLIPFADWLPEVVGTMRELIYLGSIPVEVSSEDIRFEKVQPEVPKPDIGCNDTKSDLKFIDADVSKYRKRLAFFRKRHAVPTGRR